MRGDPLSLFDSVIEQKLLHMHTIFLGTIVSFDSEKHVATIQPLTMQKQIGKAAFHQSVLTDIPVAHNAQFKLYWHYNDCTVGGNQGCGEGSCSCSTEQRLHVSMKYIEAGDIAICAACERDITDARRGISNTPSLGHHEIKDSIVVGVIGRQSPFQ